MVSRTGGARRKTRFKFQKRKSEKGKISIRRYLQQFAVGDKVLLKADPSVHSGMYFRRLHGQIGVVGGKRGGCYEVSVKEGHKNKTLIVHPVHLLKVK